MAFSRIGRTSNKFIAGSLTDLPLIFRVPRDGIHATSFSYCCAISQDVALVTCRPMSSDAVCGCRRPRCIRRPSLSSHLASQSARHIPARFLNCQTSFPSARCPSNFLCGSTIRRKVASAGETRLFKSIWQG